MVESHTRHSTASTGARARRGQRRRHLSGSRGNKHTIRFSDDEQRLVRQAVQAGDREKPWE